MENGKKPQWYLDLDISNRDRAKLDAQYSPHRDGWVKWYRGKTRFVCSKNVPPGRVDEEWDRLRAQIDGASGPVSHPDSITLRDLYSRYIEREERRVKTGRPRPLSPFTLEDQIRTLRAFVKAVGGSKAVSELSAADFAAYAATLDNRAASTAARHVAYVKAMFAWGDDAGHCERPKFGPDFVKPPAAVRRDERIDASKMYTSDEIGRVWLVARDDERLWMALALTGGMDNSDVANLTRDIIDMEAGVFDYRRRKVGKVRRIIPIHRTVLQLLPPYLDGPMDGRLFLTPSGHPLVRMKPSSKRSGRANPIDYIAMRWTRLLQEAGIREKPHRITIEEEDGTVRRPLSWKPSEERRGFRGLRTTFSNLVPPGYREERDILMGHATGTTFLDNYLEKIGTDRLREAVRHVWGEIFIGPAPLDEALPANFSGSSPRRRG
ncbi:MAG TPA: hypothetical protein VHQ47_08995 [Phycisphaerae bacterium]|nr:hypothetical protein [Phycisphaerae bacterium]